MQFIRNTKSYFWKATLKQWFRRQLSLDL
jgi:hypothetical protein